MSRLDYEDGGFRLETTVWRAFFAPDGTLSQAEYKRWGNGTLHCYLIPERHHKVLSAIARKGREEAGLARWVYTVEII